MMCAMTFVGSWLSENAANANGAVIVRSRKRPIIFSTPATSVIASMSRRSGAMGFAPAAFTEASSMQAP